LFKMISATQETGGGRRRKNGVPVWILGAILCFSIPARAAFPQETDPFYRKWLETGEASYFVRNYTQAVEYLKIAAFGLSRDANLQARAHVFLALCLTALGENAAATASLTSAAGVVGWDALEIMDLPGEAKSRLETLLRGIPRTTVIAPQPTPVLEPEKTLTVSPPSQPELPPAETRAADAPPADARTIPDLRREMEADPRNPDPYFELARRFREIGDSDSALETLENLLDETPAAIRAHLEIGRLEYLAGNPKSAIGSLEKFLSLTGNVPVEERFRDEGTALLLLSLTAKGERKKAARLLQTSGDLFRPERFERLTLDPADLERLRALLKVPSP